MMSHFRFGRMDLSLRRIAVAIPAIALLTASAPLQGQRGPASAQTQKPAISTQTLQGEIQLTEPRVVTAQRIVLDHLRLTTNGHGLELFADVIEVRGFATIRAFGKGDTPSATGEPGRSAGLVSLNARRLIGPSIEIDNSGEDGAAGREGEDGASGPSGAPGTPRDWQPWSGCSGGKAGEPGGPGGRGGAGGPGGAGGNGGVVLLEIQIGGDATATKAVSKGGKGGKGGDGGDGGPGGGGGSGGPPVNVCGGTSLGRPGLEGPDGESGRDGSDGAPGQILDILKRKSQRPPLKGIWE